jgi:hypothetical protein
MEEPGQSSICGAENGLVCSRIHLEDPVQVRLVDHHDLLLASAVCAPDAAQETTLASGSMRL